MSKFILVLFAISYLAIPAWGFVLMRQYAPVEAIAGQADPQPDPRYLAGKELFRWGLIAIGIAVLGNIPLMGLPGMLVLALGKLTGLTARNLEGDRVWPAAILATLIFPLGISLAVLLKNLVFPEGGAWVAIGFIACWLIGTNLACNRMG